MSVATCFEVASGVIEDASERFLPIFGINRENTRIFRQYCSGIDEIARAFDGVIYEVSVDEITMEITVAVYCREMITETPGRMVSQLASRAIRHSFCVSEEGLLGIAYVFPPLWEKIW